MKTRVRDATVAAATPDQREMIDEIIELHRDDDIDTILDRLEWVSGRHVLIVIPGSSDMLASLVNLRLLRRRAQALSLHLLLVAKDGHTRRLANEAGVRAFGSRWAAVWALRRLQRRHKTPREVVVGTTNRGDEPTPDGTTRRRPRKRPGDRFRLHTLRPKRRFLSGIFTALALLGLAFALGLTLVLLVPEATVTVVPDTAQISQIVRLTADPEVDALDFEARIVPARLISVRVEGSGEIPTVDRRDAPADRATGEVWFSNRSNEEVILPMGTAVRTSTGVNVRFTTVQTVTVPAGVGSRAVAPVVAVVPGPSGNVGPFLISGVEGTMALRVSAVNDEPTRGGTVTQMGVVTRADRERLKTELLSRLQQEAMARIWEQLDLQEFVPPETLRVFIINEVYDRFIDELADSVGMKLQISANAVAIAEQEANRIALDALQKGVPADYALMSRGITFARGDVEDVDDERRVVFTMTASGVATARLDTRGLREELAGQTIVRAEEIIVERLAIRRAPVIDVRPDWLGGMPGLPFRIRIVILTGME